MAVFLGVAVALLGFLLGIYIVIRKIIYPEIVMGWSSIMSVVLMTGGVIMLMLGLIGEYIGRIYLCISNTPQYVIKEIYGSKTEKKL